MKLLRQNLNANPKLKPLYACRRYKTRKSSLKCPFLKVVYQAGIRKMNCNRSLWSLYSELYNESNPGLLSFDQRGKKALAEPGREPLLNWRAQYSLPPH
jgi:hypothetical protein